MRDSFSGFYGVNEDVIASVFTSENTTFIYDANVLLSLYRCEEETRNQFISIWKKIQNQCWFPHQVCLEYQRNRLKVIKSSRDSLTDISKEISSSIEGLKTKVFGESHNQTISRYTNLGGELKNFFMKVEELTNDFSAKSIIERNRNIDFLSGHDVIRDLIDELTAHKIGTAPTDQKMIDELNKEGKIRYKYKTGPGFADQADKKILFTHLMALTMMPSMGIYMYGIKFCNWWHLSLEKISFTLLMMLSLISSIELMGRFGGLTNHLLLK